jgi:cytochrome d ubiquinol oxidase subunit I
VDFWGGIGCQAIHLACIWLAVIGTLLSAYFILAFHLAANSWMQHPVGAVVNCATHRAELHDFVAVLTRNRRWAQHGAGQPPR